jgi:hypothetical protein
MENQSRAGSVTVLVFEGCEAPLLEMKRDEITRCKEKGEREKHWRVREIRMRGNLGYLCLMTSCRLSYQTVDKGIEGRGCDGL